MRQFDIYHATGADRFTETEVQPRELVGSVLADNIDQAYERSQNLSSDWNPDKPCRSTSMGDIIQDGDKQYLVCGLGFRLLGKAAEEQRADAILKWNQLPPEIQEQFEPQDPVLSEEEQRELDMLSAANDVDMNSIRNAGLN